MFESLQPACYGVASTFFAISTITILLRTYSRSFVIKNFKWDDWCMLAILFFNAGQQCILYYFLHYGGGLHIDIILANHPTYLSNLTYALFAEEIYYVWMHWIIKMAFLLFYLRFATNGFRTLVYLTIGLNTIFTIIMWLLYCFQCMPLDAFFHKAVHPTVKCLDNSILAFVPAALTISIDIVIFILPIRPLWTIQVNLRKRLMLISIISLGGIVVIISMIRLIVLLQFQKTTDISYVLGKLIIISSVEIEVAIITANAPSLQALFATYCGSSSRDIYRPQSSIATASQGNSQSKRKWGRATSYHVTSCSPGPREAKELENLSEESIQKEVIVVTSSVGVETETWDAHVQVEEAV